MDYQGFAVSVLLLYYLPYNFSIENMIIIPFIYNLLCYDRNKW